MNPRINMIMVGASNIAMLRQFYEQGLGWSLWMPASEGSAAYKVGTSILIFVNSAYLANESGIPAVETPKSLFAIFVESKEEVHAAFDRAVAAGATITSPIRDRDQGLYSGYFSDPEENSWEVVWSPHMPLAPDGALTLPEQLQ
jgi:predicted lactoylglutathione lyase